MDIYKEINNGANREITNMKPDDLRACIPCILDNTVKEKAKQIAAYLK